jgi:hypothetical protein
MKSPRNQRLPHDFIVIATVIVTVTVTVIVTEIANRGLGLIKNHIPN